MDLESQLAQTTDELKRATSTSAGLKAEVDALVSATRKTSLSSFLHWRASASTGTPPVVPV